MLRAIRQVAGHWPANGFLLFMQRGRMYFRTDARGFQ
jgi:hypothetical protein